MNTNEKWLSPQAPSNSDRLAAILETMNYSFQKEAFLQALGAELVDSVTLDQFNAAVVVATYFAK